MELGLAGRVALVCGSTKGLGRAVAKALAQEGARVAVNGRHQDSVERVAQQLEAETSRTVVPLVADVGTPAEAEGMVERVARELGRLDILFCNASGPPAAPFSHQTADAFQRAVEVNLLSTVHLARAAVPVMRKVQWGRIICLASVPAKQPVPGLILSTTARAGVLGFAKALADEVAPEGITVNVVCPGFIATERIEDLTETRAKREHRSSQEVMRCSRFARVSVRSSIRSVAMNPGHTTLTVIPSGATSSASALAKPSTPARAVVERIRPGTGCFAATEARQMMRPHWTLRITGTAARARCTVESRLTSTARWNASAVWWLNGAAGGPLALQNRMSSRPSSRATRSTIPSASAGGPTSPTQGPTLRPLSGPSCWAPRPAGGLWRPLSGSRAP